MRKKDGRKEEGSEMGNPRGATRGELHGFRKRWGV